MSISKGSEANFFCDTKRSTQQFGKIAKVPFISYLITKKYQFLAKEKLINRATQKNAKIKRISSFPQSSLLNKIGRVHF